MNKVEIKFAKTRKNAVIPSKRDEDAGFDIYACYDEDITILKPHETRMFKTGLVSAFPAGYVIILFERGSTGTRGIGQRSGVIDSGYRGEWLVPVTNHNDIPLIITKTQLSGGLMSMVERGEAVLYPASKAICQGILLPVPFAKVSECSMEDVCSIQSERGSGKLGSSGK